VFHQVQSAVQIPDIVIQVNSAAVLITACQQARHVVPTTHTPRLGGSAAQIGALAPLAHPALRTVNVMRVVEEEAVQGQLEV
jgi:hypothetical protein